MVQKYLKDHQLEQDVILKGSHCFDNCSAGPTMKIGEKIYEQVNSETVMEILETEFGEM